jgi:hypothetical protein
MSLSKKCHVDGLQQRPEKIIIHQFETMPFAARYFAAGYFENCSPGIV